MNKKNLIVGVVVALAAVGAVAGYQLFFGGKPTSTFNMACAYESCGWQGNRTLKQGDTYPPTCPKCGKQSVLPLAKCKKCGNLQLLNEEIKGILPETDKLSSNTACKKCGGPIRHGD